jgi:hypothetical protein
MTREGDGAGSSLDLVIAFAVEAPAATTGKATQLAAADISGTGAAAVHLRRGLGPCSGGGKQLQHGGAAVEAHQHGGLVER